MNATGDSDIRNYYDRIKAQQEDELRPVLRVLYAVLFRASVGSVRRI
ncbi:phage portal protein [Xylella fastidiosa]